MIFDELADFGEPMTLKPEVQDELYKLLADTIPQGKPYYVSAAPLTLAEAHEAVRPKLREIPVVAVHPADWIAHWKPLVDLETAEERERQWNMRRQAMLDQWARDAVAPPPSSAPFIPASDRLNDRSGEHDVADLDADEECGDENCQDHQPPQDLRPRNLVGAMAPGH